MITPKDKPKNKGGRPVRPTNRQKRAAMLVVEKDRKGEALRAAGYSESIATHPEKVLGSAGFKIAAKEIVEQLEKQRQLALARMAQTISEADYAASTRGVDTMTKNIELLSGRPTNRDEVKDFVNLEGMSAEAIAKAIVAKLNG